MNGGDGELEEVLMRTDPSPPHTHTHQVSYISRGGRQYTFKLLTRLACYSVEDGPCTVRYFSLSLSLSLYRN